MMNTEKNTKEVYQDELLDHYKNPRNKRKLATCDFSSGEHNITCGDRVIIEGCIKDNNLTDVGFSGSGCVISQATASLLTDLCKGKTVDEILKLTKDDVLNLIGIQLGPTRLRCALLSLEVLQQGLLDYRSKH